MLVFEDRRSCDDLSLGVMLATQVILCITIVGNGALFVMALNERPSAIRAVFACYVACIAAWSFAIYLNLFLESTLVEEWIFASAAGVLTTQFWFAKSFSAGKLPAGVLPYWSLCLGCSFMLASFYPGALFTSIFLHPEGYTILDNGPLSTLYSLFAFTYVCAPIVIFARSYRAASTMRLRRQLRDLTISFSLFAIIAVLTNSVLPVFFQLYTFNAIGPAFSLILASAVFYLIWKYDFLDIRRAVERGVIYTFLVAIIIAVYEVLLMLADRDFSLRSDVATQLSAATVTAAGILAIPIIERRFRKLTDRIFFKNEYDYAAALESLSRTLNRTADFDELVRSMQEGLATIFRAESVKIVLYGEDDPPHMTAEQNAVMIEDREELFESIEVDGVAVGDILICQKLSGDAYRAEDVRLLRTFALQASIALARARLFLQVQRHALELEETVARRTEELRRMHESERQMMLDIAHGLQTPLSVLRTKLSKLRPLREETIGIDGFEHSLVQFSDFVGALLKLAHLENNVELRLEACPLSQLLADLCDEVRVIATSRGIVMSSRIIEHVFVEADTRELHSAVANVLSNSIKYMRSAGPKEIAVCLERDGRYARLTIQDSGIGIGVPDLAYIFDRFYRVPGSEVSGNGIGLAIAKKIIEHHGGTIGVESTLGQGTTTLIRLPLIQG